MLDIKHSGFQLLCNRCHVKHAAPVEMRAVQFSHHDWLHVLSVWGIKASIQWNFMWHIHTLDSTEYLIAVSSFSVNRYINSYKVPSFVHFQYSKQLSGVRTHDACISSGSTNPVQRLCTKWHQGTSPSVTSEWTMAKAVHFFHPNFMPVFH